MTLPLKTYVFSIVVHATIIGVLYVIPATSAQRFSSNGEPQVHSFQMSQDSPATSTTVSLTLPPATPISSVDSPSDPVAPSESPDRQFEAELLDPLETSRGDSPKLAVPRRLPELKFDVQRTWKRRQFEAVPQPIDKLTPRRLRSLSLVSRPPVELFAGLEKKTSADLSQNQPPSYPLEAVRRRLEGVVLLRLRITATGAVESVELIESSGHPVLDRAAIDAVARWEGTPARRWGRPIESSERLPVRFRL